MTDAINPFSRQAPSNLPLRKMQDKATESAAATSSGASAAAVPLDTVNAGKPPAAPTNGADTKAFNAISARLKQEPEFDRTKVDSIKQAIENGQYPLNSRRIAESFVALEQLIGN
jgi:negative regulator of flagellin synthesis FlgM